MSNRDDHLRDMIAAEAAERFVAESEHAGDEDALSWFRSSPVHIAEYLGMAQLSTDLVHAAKRIDVPLETLIADAREDANIIAMPARDLRGPAGAAQRAPRSNLARIAVGLATAAILAAGIGLIWNGPAANGAQQFTTGHGEERTIRLSDGTFVHLNTDSALDVKFARDMRLVELERGEAYFEVAKAPARPFRVRAGATEFQDAGTAFNVFRKNLGIVVTVAEGRVEVFHAGAAETASRNMPAPLADLSAGEQATVSASGAITATTTPNLDQVLAWTRQEIVFDRESIGDVAAEFNRYNDVAISVSDPRIASIAISGNFRVRDERAFVAFLNHLRGVRTGEKDGKIVVSAKGR
jgi:transmembrane sensor